MDQNLPNTGANGMKEAIAHAYRGKFPNAKGEDQRSPTKLRLLFTFWLFVKFMQAMRALLGRATADPENDMNMNDVGGDPDSGQYGDKIFYSEMLILLLVLLFTTLLGFTWIVRKREGWATLRATVDNTQIATFEKEVMQAIPVQPTTMALAGSISRPTDDGRFVDEAFTKPWRKEDGSLAQVVDAVIQEDQRHICCQMTSVRVRCGRDGDLKTYYLRFCGSEPAQEIQCSQGCCGLLCCRAKNKGSTSVGPLRTKETGGWNKQKVYSGVHTNEYLEGITICDRCQLQSQDSALTGDMQDFESQSALPFLGADDSNGPIITLLKCGEAWLRVRFANNPDSDDFALFSISAQCTEEGLTFCDDRKLLADKVLRGGPDTEEPDPGALG
eukprot:810676-Rhodomonas_salina.1